MLAPAVFGISNSGINLAIDLLILFLVVIWLALVYWTYADARRRISDPWIVGSATVASLFPFVGTLVYMIVRPPEYLDDVRERELEIQAAEARLAELGYHLCPHCDYEVEKDFLRCPNCMRKLKDPCPVCGKPLDPELAHLPLLRGRGRQRRPGAAASPAPARRAHGSSRDRTSRGGTSRAGRLSGIGAPGGRRHRIQRGLDPASARAQRSVHLLNPTETGHRLVVHGANAHPCQA